MHAERARAGRFIQWNLSSIANCGMPQAISIAPQLLRPSEQCCSPGGSFDGVQLEKRSWLSHKDALNQVIGFGR